MSDDTMPKLRDPENGQYVSLTTLFERERVEHSKDHEQERVVAKETAQRLEREVEQTALRLERVVEETAVRIEKAVATALQAVSETARVHSEAHQKEHVAHERIHQVEKVQVDKAETAMNRRLEGMNEFRAALNDQAKTAVHRDYYDARHEDLRERLARGDQALNERLNLIEKRVAYYAGAAAVAGVVGGIIAGVIFR